MPAYTIELYYRPKRAEALHFDCKPVRKSGRNKAEALRLATQQHGLPAFYTITLHR